MHETHDDAGDGLPVVIRFRASVRVETAPDGTVVVRRDGRSLALRDLTPGERNALAVLRERGAAEETLDDLVADGGVQSLAEWQWRLGMLERLAALEFAAVDGSQTLAVLVPQSPDFRMRPAALRADRRYVLSSFAFARREGVGLTVESPLALARVELDEEAGCLLGILGRARPLPELLARATLSADQARTILGLLASAGILHATDDDECAEDRTARAAGWCFADALFHFRSRIGRHEHRYGAKPEDQRGPEPPDRNPPVDGERIPLERPDLERLRATDPPLMTVTESRHSIRRCAPKPIDRAQVGEFLFRTARVRPHPVVGGPAASRPYPSGGACYPLTLYLAVRSCGGLPPGLYRYDPFGHELVCLRVTREASEAVLDTYRDRGVETLQVVIVMAARLRRVTWKYESMAYAVVLKEVGVLMQSMYLAATAMRLAPCAIGGGTSDTLPRAVGVDPLEEATVGEFALGSRP